MTPRLLDLPGSVPPSSCTSGLIKRFRCARRGARESAGVSIQMDSNRAPSLISAIRLSLLTTEIAKVKGESRASDLLGEALLNRLDRTLLKKSGKRRGNIEFAALRQVSQICDTTLPVEEQEYPAFPARELARKGVRRCGRDNPENESCVKSSFLYS